MYLVILRRFLPSGAAAIENHSIKKGAREVKLYNSTQMIDFSKKKENLNIKHYLIIFYSFIYLVIS